MEKSSDKERILKAAKEMRNLLKLWEFFHQKPYNPEGSVAQHIQSAERGKKNCNQEYTIQQGCHSQQKER